MTFRPKLLTDVPGRTPDVQIFFYGQLLLRSEDGATCEVAVNPIATNHVLTIEVRTKTSGQSAFVNMRHVGPLPFRQREGMLIEVLNPAAASPAAWNCRTFEPIDYVSGLVPSRDDDFRWILNLEGLHFHQKDLNPTVFNSQHVIRLQGGEYFFRTAVRAKNLFDLERRGGGKDPMRFKRIGAVASASVFFDSRQQVKLSWQASSREGDHTLTLPQRQDTTYEIYINNAPLYMDPPRDAELEQLDELIEYYKVVSEIPPTIPGTSARFQLVPVKPPPPLVNGESAPDSGLADSASSELDVAGDKGTPDIPCQVMRLDGLAND